MTDKHPTISQWHLQQTRLILLAGGVIAYPTEAVWGLGCDPWNADAVDRLLELKDRPAHKGLILVAASVAQIEFLLAPLKDSLRHRALECWPGPVTCLLPDIHHQIPANVRGNHRSVAVRISDHPLVQQLCETAGGPLVSTSCNPTGRQPARQVWQVHRYFGHQLDKVVPGRLGGQKKPSQILDIATGRWLR
ncbi:L-threonylcarbamoyladenylate synthase [Marinobacter changyiensis]|uniref:L-threonylcarbamoyladenylate synthase n=1 Tax=Marinobacter changyiensis TaxID=2604091 RepID=UPI00126532E6|nr:Sua5/YciO/YrdC/YwlC family protein [Marinobacter changyiensis]